MRLHRGSCVVLRKARDNLQSQTSATKNGEGEPLAHSPKPYILVFLGFEHASTELGVLLFNGSLDMCPDLGALT